MHHSLSTIVIHPSLLSMMIIIIMYVYSSPNLICHSSSSPYILVIHYAYSSSSFITTINGQHTSLPSFIITTHTHRHPSPFITIHYHSPWSIISYQHTIYPSAYITCFHPPSSIIIRHRSSSFYTTISIVTTAIMTSPSSRQLYHHQPPNYFHLYKF